MNTRKFVLPAVVWASAVLLWGVVSAQAQATRTWVSGVGDDANPCSRIAPCKTWAGAISKTQAGGEIEALDPGGFGALTITKSITIDGGGFQVAGVLVALTNAFVVAAPADAVVTIRYIRFNGVGTGQDGIKFTSGKSLQIENCEIFEFANNGINISLNQATAASVLIKNTRLFNNANGIRATNANGAALVNVVIDGVVSTLGVNGIVAADNSRVRISDTVAAHNSNDGFEAVSTSAAVEMDLDRCESANNTNNGVEAQGNSALIRLGGSKIVGNNAGLAPGTGQIISFGNNSIGGNNTNGSPTATIPRQ